MYRNNILLKGKESESVGVVFGQKLKLYDTCICKLDHGTHSVISPSMSVYCVLALCQQHLPGEFVGDGAEYSQVFYTESVSSCFPNKPLVLHEYQNLEETEKTHRELLMYMYPVHLAFLCANVFGVQIKFSIT